ncbi:MAG: hypothetical protein ABS56_02755 [Lautropia sp. SCN 69-89]|nr:MAG: hypothetical protein ABS56_02755 [Lautropia sp. SCN 69-89]
MRSSEGAGRPLGGDRGTAGANSKPIVAERGADRKLRRGRGKAQATLELIEACQEILVEIQPASVRAVCYRLFTMGLIPDMSKNSTNRVSTQLVWAREQGIIPWEHVVDETREAERVGTWSDPGAIIAAAVRGYRRDYWQDQPYRVEVWSEKGTVRGTIAPVLDELGVTFRVMHGFASATTINAIADESTEDTRPFIALYIGDFDPSGMFMSEVDLPERMGRYGGLVTIDRIALQHFDLGGLPHFDVTTKSGDARYSWFVRRFGARCWELDAMSPNLLRERVRESIFEYIDLAAWDRAVSVERAEVESMRQFHAEWKRHISGPAAKYPTDGGAS